MNHLTGKQMEELVLFRARELEKQHILTMCRYGVQVMWMKDPATGQPKMQAVPSLPDFDGCIFGTGQQFNVEVKVCSAASYPLYATHGKRPKQINHMLLRARFGALCYLMIHFNARELIKKTEPAETFALRVHPDEPFWREYENTDVRSLSRGQAEMYGVRVPWTLYSPRAMKLTPDLRALIPNFVPAGELL